MGAGQDEGEGMLLRLPNELLLLILTHVQGRHLIHNVRLVCRKFHCLLTNQQWWLSRIHKMPQNIRLSEAEMKAEDFDAARSFIAVEEETQRWSKWVASKKWPLESTKLGSAGMCLGNTPNGLAACSTFGKKVFH
ncbi:F-box domain protein [Ancylostoma duodenale]|uniref:F-box domain protein n=1 Tax=Ancylostoma duodenale TaxID=51022 RepID=A0A0C2GPW8_9BILA|nr:F-box domain protein [Ancylostoma duodenale]